MENVGLWVVLTIILNWELFSCQTSVPGAAPCFKECYSQGICDDLTSSICDASTSSTDLISYASFPPELLSIRLRDKNGTGYELEFAWFHHKESVSTTQYDVRISEYDGFVIGQESLRANYTSCYQVKVPEGYDDDIRFVYDGSCGNIMQAGTNYSIQLTSKPNNISLKYFFTTPVNFTQAFGIESLDDWVSLVAIATARINQTSHLYVVFQEAPTRFNISHYHVSFSDNYVYESDIILKNNISCTASFSRVATNNDDSYVNASVRQDDCSSGFCIRSQYHGNTSPNIMVLGNKGQNNNDEKVPTGPLTEIAMTTVSRASTSVLADTTSATHVVVPPEEDNTRRNVTIAVAVVCAVVVAGIVIGVIYCLWKKKQCCVSGNFSMQRFRNQDDTGSTFALDVGFKSPSVLILYSYDCEAHESVIVEYASYLKHVFRCDVSMDIWEQAEIQSRGPYDWIREKLQYCHYVIIVCSIGARFKCVRNKQFSVKESRPVPDIFQDAVEMVAENIRSSRESGANTAKFIVTYFEYSRDTDIPPKLDTVDFYFLMRDVFKLYCHIYGISPEGNHYKSYHGLSQETYSSTETGQQLYTAIKNANRFFQDNPNWLGDTLEPLAPPTPPSDPSSNRDPLPPGGSLEEEGDHLTSHEDSPVRSLSSPEGPVNSGLSRVSSTSVSMASEDDSLIDERRKKRQKELMGSLNRVKKSRIRNDSVDSMYVDTSDKKPVMNGHVYSNGHHDTNVPLHHVDQYPDVSRDNDEYIPPKAYQTAFNNGPYLANQRSLQEDEESFVCDDKQLQKDIDHIQNYDLHHQYQKPAVLSDITLDTAPISNKFIQNGYDGPGKSSLSFSNQLYDIHMGTRITHSSLMPNGVNNNFVKNNMNDNNNISDFRLPPPLKSKSRSVGQSKVHQDVQLNDKTTSL